MRKKVIICSALLISMFVSGISTSYAAGSGGCSLGTLTNTHTSSSGSFTSKGYKSLQGSGSFSGGGTTVRINSSNYPLTGDIVMLNSLDSPSAKKYSTAPKSGKTVRVTAKASNTANNKTVAVSVQEVNY